MTKRQVESRQLRVQARLNHGEFEICDMNGQVYRIDVKDNDMEGEDNVLLYAQESHRSNDPELWCWERFHIAGPIPRPPLNPTRDVCFDVRWHRRLSREVPNRTWKFYRNEFDVVEESQIIWEPYVLQNLSHVAAICRESSELWWAHVPIFCMAVMEVHMPERVWRQFGAPQVIPPAPE
ncbi:hypothetical protein Taro_008834 [Colocasia esculenta]|uniref:Aminotransferase-like plant mobile domain-containing protein n=1 Tax=Colocasia esculenta TaxID=4460 RepID=A0A843U4M5_COLES|nr:hypothetical protein [Colocasia esculenta]